MMRIVAFLCAVAGLGGCGVMSDHPLFSVADGEGAPILRPGVWVATEPDCKFNPRGPAASWPACASAFILGPGAAGEVRREVKGEAPSPEPAVQAYLLAAGDPVIVQVQTPPEAKASYFALRPMASDGGGQITRVRLWPILCEPPHAESERPGPPLPGLKPLGGPGGGCLARTQAAVRDAARRSEAWAFRDEPASGVLRWIRDGDR